jgi:hypothetical protein
MNVVSFLAVSKDKILFIVKGKLYTITREGNAYYLVTEDKQKFRIKEFSVDCDSVLIVCDERLPVDWDFVEGGEL